MKKKQLKKRLTINKETVANLDESQLKDVKGGQHHNLPTVAPENSCPTCGIASACC